MSAPPPAFFLPGASAQGGQRFCLFHPAESSARGVAIRGLVVYIHPFAEEMNKARRMAALQARALSQAGYAVLQMDLLGCGDSSGDFGDATWKSWVDDVVLACQWLGSHTDGSSGDGHRAPLWLWGLRAGCLLAVEAASQLDKPCNFLFWQPPSAGKPLLQQFLRLRLAGDLLGGQSKGIMEQLRQQIANGMPVEIAGYSLSAALAGGLERAELSPPSGTRNGQRMGQRMEWLELSTREGSDLSPASTKTLALWQQAGVAVRSHVVTGPAFWQTIEIEEAPALLAATLAAFDDRVPP